MPDSGYVVDCAGHLRMAWYAFCAMEKSGADGGRALNEEIGRSGMAEEAMQAASVWVEYLLEIRDPGRYGNDHEEKVTMAEKWRVVDRSSFQTVEAYLVALEKFDRGASVGRTDLGPVVTFTDGSQHRLGAR